MARASTPVVSEGRSDALEPPPALTESGLSGRRWSLGEVRLAAVLIVALGAAMRLWRFDELPGGLLLDEAFNGVDVLEVLDGARPIFFTRNFGREPLFLYLQALSVWAVGVSPFALRLVAFGFGLLAVPATYAATRRLAGPWAGLAAAAWIATAPYPVIFSRVGLRAICIPALTALSLYSFERALSARTEGLAARWAAASALLMAAGIWTYTAARLVPIVPILWLAVLLARREVSWRRAGLVAGVAALVGALALAPLGMYFLRHPAEFFERANAVSAFNPEQNEGSTVRALWLSLVRTAGAFNFQGDLGWDRNVAGQPIFDPLTGLLFLAGLGLAVLGLARHPGRALLLLWLLVMSVPNLVTTLNVPNYLRLVGALPAMAALMGLGAQALVGWRRWSWWSLAPLALWCAGVGGLAVFDGWAGAPERYYVFQADRMAALRIARLEASQDRRVYVAGAAEFDPVVRFIGGPPEQRAFGVFDPRVALVLPPPGLSAAYVLPQGMPQAADLARLLPPRRVPIAHDPRGEVSVEFAPAARYEPPPVARTLGGTVGDLAELRSYDLPRAAEPGQTVAATIVARALRHDVRDLIWFAHLVDRDERVWARRDVFGIPAVGWRLGDFNVVRLELTVPPDAPAGVYRVVSGLYDRASLGRLPIGEVDRLVLGPIWVAGPAPEPPAPAVRLDRRFDDALALEGYTLDGAALSLRWRALREVDGDYTLFLHLLDREGKLVGQADAPPARPTSTWRPGASILDRRALPAAPGAVALSVGLYEPTSGRRLGLDGGGDAVRIPLG